MHRSNRQEGNSEYEFLNTTSSANVKGLRWQNISIVNDDINRVTENPALLGHELK